MTKNEEIRKRLEKEWRIKLPYSEYPVCPDEAFKKETSE